MDTIINSSSVKKLKRILSVLVVQLLGAPVLSVITPLVGNKALSRDNGEGHVPIMGWSSWNNFRVNISESLIKQQTDYMVSTDMKTAGYSHINIDDGWFGGRDGSGNVYPNASKFPSGMKSLADYIHSKGLNVGIYSDAGNNTCGSIYDNDTNGIGVGLYGHEQQDCDLFFKTWGYDFIKVDWCGGQALGLNEQTAYTNIHNAITNTGKSVVYNICCWQFPGAWAMDVGSSWRISWDINPSFDSICSIIDANASLSQYAGPGHFNDMDMLQVGRGMTYEEDKAHFSMWCMLASPLLAGNDLSAMSSQTISILTNTEVIAVDQDSAGIQGTRVKDLSDQEVWCKPLGSANGNVKAVALFNRGTSDSNITVNWSDIGLKDSSANLRDLWTKSDIGSYSNSYTASVPAHAVKMLKITGTADTKTSTEFSTEKT